MSADECKLSTNAADMTKDTEKSLEPDYLHNPEKCPCPRSAENKCPRARNCEACIAYHRSREDSPRTYCEKKALSEGFTV